MTDPGQEREIHRITCVGRLTGSTKRQHILIGAFPGWSGIFPDGRPICGGPETTEPMQRL